jgi:5-amino-6-(5-phosphoribosylamino)uracil reductase
MQRPHTTIVLAMSADGKIADAHHAAPQFGSKRDWEHLETQVASADGVLFGASTLRAGGTAMRVISPALIQARRDRAQSDQPIQMVCSHSGQLDPNLQFFRQPIPRWLITPPTGADPWQQGELAGKFDQVLSYATSDSSAAGIPWATILADCWDYGLRSIAVLGGGELVASLLEANCVDDLWLTLCPVLLGGRNAPTPFDGIGFAQQVAPKLELLSVEHVAGEVFLYYRVLPVV